MKHKIYKKLGCIVYISISPCFRLSQKSLDYLLNANTKNGRRTRSESKFILNDYFSLSRTKTRTQEPEPVDYTYYQSCSVFGVEIIQFSNLKVSRNSQNIGYGSAQPKDTTAKTKTQLPSMRTIRPKTKRKSSSFTHQYESTSQNTHSHTTETLGTKDNQKSQFQQL